MRIYLRAFEPEDSILINQWRNDEEISRSLGGNHYFVSLAREKVWVQNKSIDDNQGVYLSICLKDNCKMIGYISLVNIDLRNSKAEIGGWIIGDKSLWNKGYAKESVSLLMQYAFSQYPINKCSSYCLEEHSISIKTHASLGFRQDGILRAEVYKNGEFKNLLVFSILRSEFVAKYGELH